MSNVTSTLPSTTPSPQVQAVLAAIAQKQANALAARQAAADRRTAALAAQQQLNATRQSAILATQQAKVAAGIAKYNTAAQIAMDRKNAQFANVLANVNQQTAHQQAIASAKSAAQGAAIQAQFPSAASVPTATQFATGVGGDLSAPPVADTTTATDGGGIFGGNTTLIYAAAAVAGFLIFFK